MVVDELDIGKWISYPATKSRLEKSVEIEQREKVNNREKSAMSVENWSKMKMNEWQKKFDWETRKYRKKL